MRWWRRCGSTSARSSTPASLELWVTLSGKRTTKARWGDAKGTKGDEPIGCRTLRRFNPFAAFLSRLRGFVVIVRSFLSAFIRVHLRLKCLSGVVTHATDVM